jgi:hypothetical protein
LLRVASALVLPQLVERAHPNTTLRTNEPAGTSPRVIRAPAHIAAIDRT